MKQKLLLFAVIAIAFIAIGVYSGSRVYSPSSPESTAVQYFFAQEFPDSDGKIQSLAQWKGRPLVVNFWATWCAPCVDEMPELAELQTEIASQNVQILGIGIDSAINIADFASRYKIDYPLYVAGVNGTELSRQFGNQMGGLPYTVLISSDGNIKNTYIGRLDMAELRHDIESLK